MHFNSSMVRLGAKASTDVATTLAKFQFQYGTIGGNQTVFDIAICF